MPNSVRVWEHDGVAQCYADTPGKILVEKPEAIAAFKQAVEDVEGKFLSYFNPFNKPGAAVAALVRMTPKQRLAFEKATGYKLRKARVVSVN